MNLHDWKYASFLLAKVKQLYVEREAMSTILDSPASQQKGVAADWRSAAAQLHSSAVFQSSVEANFAPVFERMRVAMTSETALAQLTSQDASAIREASDKAS